MMQQIDVSRCGVPPRVELVAMQAAPFLTDVPRSWISSLVQARNWLDEADALTDDSPRREQLIDLASDVEEAAIKAFQRAFG